MRIMSLDYGDKRIGVAVSDEQGSIAGPLTVIQRESMKKDLQRINELVETYGVARLVVGLPLNMDGSRGETAAKVEKFVNRLKGRVKVPVVYWDERLTSKIAANTLREANARKTRETGTLDKMAAVIILQSYLDQHD
ncbi:MAG TPA: Holliday junction resolvase RuvX [Firmicutes bacterium]|nr:Holliday junction resolvase RuvX [Bacillota bacterium]